MGPIEKPKGEPSRNKRRLAFAKPLVIAGIAVVLIAAAALLLPRILTDDEPTSVTTYQVEEISYGNVSTTISGSGNLTPITLETVSSKQGGTASSVNFVVGDEVASGDVLAVISTDDGDEDITAPCDGVLVEFPVKEGDEIAPGASVAQVMGKDGFTMGIAVDELDIASVALDQEVTFTIDAVDGTQSGFVTEISYNGSTSGGSTAYQITATMDYVEGVYPGMSATAEIVIEDSGDGLVVPVDAVRTSGDDSYVYLAPADAEAGGSYEEDELSLEALTKVTVETGMSDGSYILIESDELEEGDLVVITKVTSTLTGSEGEGSDSGFGGMGGFGDVGDLSGLDGMDFEDFDFENFDPGQMPQGGGDLFGMSS